MSKGNLFMGRAKGKVGSVVFSVLKGQQITRAHNANNSSRTKSQVAQRVHLAGLVYFYKMCILNFFRFAFNDKKALESDYNAFVRSNIMAHPVFLTKEQAGAYQPVFAPYQMSQGNLPVPGSVDFSEDDAATFILQGITVGATTTMGQVFKQIADEYGLEEGDMITCVGVHNAGLKYGQGVFTYNGVPTSMKISQFVLDFSESTLATAYNKIPGMQSLTTSSTNLFIVIQALESGIKDTCRAACIIATRNRDGKVIASTSSLTLNSAASAYYTSISSEAAQKAAMDSYGYDTAILDPNSLAD